jgi:hypothetical protein
MNKSFAIFFAAAAMVTLPAFAQDKVTQHKLDKMDKTTK